MMIKNIYLVLPLPRLKRHRHPEPSSTLEHAIIFHLSQITVALMLPTNLNTVFDWRNLDPPPRFRSNLHKFHIVEPQRRPKLFDRQPPSWAIYSGLAYRRATHLTPTCGSLVTSIISLPRQEQLIYLRAVWCGYISADEFI